MKYTVPGNSLSPEIPRKFPEILAIEGKHPEIAGRQAEVEACLRSPDLIRHSKVDKTVYLFYRSRPPYHLCVIVKRLNDTGFVITCYLTDKIKEGDQIWPISE